MFDELDDYKSYGHFFFNPTDELSKVCNAPKKGFGVYYVLELKNGRVELVYIGSSGTLLQNGKMKNLKGGFHDTIVNGSQFGDSRNRSGKQKVISENIDALDIYWFETIDAENFDIPAFMEGLIIQRYFEIYGNLPKWNIEF